MWDTKENWREIIVDGYDQNKLYNYIKLQILNKIF